MPPEDRYIVVHRRGSREVSQATLSSGALALDVTRPKTPPRLLHLALGGPTHLHCSPVAATAASPLLLLLPLLTRFFAA